MAAKVWLQDRWSMLFPLLQSLTVEQEDEIKRLCKEEIDYWRSRDISGSALRVPMTETRKQIKQWSLTDATVWLNPRTREKEHIALKYMNFSAEEWAAMNAPSAEKFNERLEDVKFIDNPDAVVAEAAGLLQSEHWYDIACGLAVLVGRRVEELVTVGELFPKTLYTVLFKGQLKRRDEILPPYEIPTLLDASVVLDAWRRLRSLEIGGTRLVSEAADRHFSNLVPGRSGGDLYTHLFRSVYGAIAVFYYAPPEVLAIKYLSNVYGHYWVLQSSGKQQQNYITTLHYQDYAIGDAAIAAHSGRRQGVKLGAPGVEVLEVFKPKEQTEKGSRKMATHEVQTKKASKTGFSSAKPKEDTRVIIDQIMEETGARIDDDALRLLCDEHYQLKQIKDLGIDLDVLLALLVEAASDNGKPVEYLSSLLGAKRSFKQSYEKRHVGKDYSSMSLSELRDTKTTEAANERFKRAVAAVMAYNDAAAVPEQKWYINPKIITDLVGGKPSLASAYLDGVQQELKEHHMKHGLTTAYNRRPVEITARLRVPESPSPDVVFESVE